VAALAGVHAGRQWRAFLRAHQRTAAVQQELLLRLVRSFASSRFGRDHGFDRIRGYDDFRRAVPICDYEYLRPYVQRVLEGELTALLGEGMDVRMFAVTSGTTGQPKHIPVTRQFMHAYHRGWNIWGLKALSDHRSAWLRRIVTISSSPREYLAPCGLPCGAISGLLAADQKWIVRRMYPVARAVAEIHDAPTKLYCILRSCIASDVAFLTTANPSSAIKLAEVGIQHADRLIRDVRDGTLSPPGELDAEISPRLRFRRDARSAKRLEQLLARHGQLLPRDYWNLSFLGHWTGGTLGLYLPRVRQLYGPALPIRDIGLLASEGRFSVPIDDGTAAGVADIQANFLEFMPADQVEQAQPDVLAADEVEIGQEYFILPSNWAGLWRYHIDDRVRVVGKLGGSPVIEFLSKGLHTASITGEKLTEHQVVAAMHQVCAELGAHLDTFEVQGRFGDSPHYQLRIEEDAAGAALAKPPDGQKSNEMPRTSAGRIAHRLDAALRRLNVEYDSKRSSGRLGEIQAICLPPGSFSRQEAQRVAARHGRAEQYKHKYLLAEVLTEP
jgi:hypothetical protein